MAASKPQLRSGRERGTVIIEMTFALPLLLLMMAGIIDLGYLFWEQEVLTNAVREGARAGARAVTDPTRGNAVPQWKVSEVRAIVQTYLRNLNIKDLAGAPITLNGVNCPYDWDTTTNPNTTTLRVRLVNIPVRMMILPNIQPFFAGGVITNIVNINAQFTMAAEWDRATLPLP